MVAALKAIAAPLKKPLYTRAKVRGMTFDHEEASAILTVLPRLMNQMIVQILLDGDLDANKKQLERKKLHIESSVSDKALLGYCTFHHMLLHLMQSRPWLLALIDSHVLKFLQSEDYRDKEHMPDMGTSPKFTFFLTFS